MTLLGELLAYQSGIPNRLSWAVRRWYVSEHLVLITLPPTKFKKETAFSGIRTNRTRCQYKGQGGRSSSEQVWTGLQRWPPDVSSRMEVSFMSGGKPTSQCITGNRHKGSPAPSSEWQTSSCENITFPQLRLPAVIMSSYLRQQYKNRPHLLMSEEIQTRMLTRIVSWHIWSVYPNFDFCLTWLKMCRDLGVVECVGCWESRGRGDLGIVGVWVWCRVVVVGSRE